MPVTTAGPPVGPVPGPAAPSGAGPGGPGLALLAPPRDARPDLAPGSTASPPSPPGSPAGPPGPPGPTGPTPRGTPVRGREAAGPVVAVGTALTVLGGGALALVLCFTLVSQLTYARAQDIAYDDLRDALSRGTVPVGQTVTEYPDDPPPGAVAAEPGSDGAAATEGPTQRRVAPGTPVALLSVPDAGIDQAVVLEGTSGSVLQRGPGHQRNSAFPGQPGSTTLYGRAWSFGGVFGRVGELERGDEIRFVTGQLSTEDGELDADAEIVYRVTSVRQGGDSFVPPDPSVPRLTLVTADGDPFLPRGALYVDAVLDSDPVPGGFRQTIELPAAEGLLAADTGAWVAVLLWSQGLLLAALALTWLRVRWGRMQTWVVGVPVVAALTVGLTGSASLLLPNLL